MNNVQQLFFLITVGPENPAKLTRAFQFAKIAFEKGLLKGIFLVDDAVCITNPTLVENIVAPTGDKLSTHLDFLIKNDAVIYCCKPCCITRNIDIEDLPLGFVVGTGVTAIDFSSQLGVNTITF